jgi:hypothetical protein
VRDVPEPLSAADHRAQLAGPTAAPAHLAENDVEAKGQSRHHGDDEHGELHPNSWRLFSIGFAHDISQRSRTDGGHSPLGSGLLELHLEGKTLVPELRRPFNLLAEGLLVGAERNGGGNETRIELFMAAAVGLDWGALERLLAA